MPKARPRTVIDGIPLVDAHLHVARPATLKLSSAQWEPDYGQPVRLAQLEGPDGVIAPELLDAHLAAEGVDVALLMSEHSPRVTGIQPIEDLLPIVAHNPRRFRPVANLNPHLHHPLVAELDRQLAMGAAALKLHPVHGGFTPDSAELYLVYRRCTDLGVPVVFHCGTSVFPGATNGLGDPALLTDVIRDFPDLQIVLAHGGRGWWYQAAAFLALAYDNVWIELSGLPPHKLPVYYAGFDLGRLARRFIFATDWPAVPGIARNARAVAGLGLATADLERVFFRNALAVYRGLEVPAA